MNQRERVLRDQFHALIRRYMARSRIMHGTVFQPGIPDALVGDCKNGLTLVEFKVDLRVGVPDRASCVGLLEGEQVLFINDMWALQAPRVYVAVRHDKSQKIYVATFNDFLVFENLNYFVGWLLK